MMVSEEKTRQLWKNIKRNIGKITIILIGAPAKDPRAIDTLVEMDSDEENEEEEVDPDEGKAIRESIETLTPFDRESNTEMKEKLKRK